MCENSDQKCLNTVLVKMIEKISNKQNVFFKNQQKDEMDLTVTQKKEIVEKLLNDNKQLFLQRYGLLLSNEELNYFDQFSDNFDIKSVLKSLKETISTNNSKTSVRNRRFQTLHQLMERGDYFSDPQMQIRNPLLFEQMIGQYMTDDEKTKLTNEKYLQNHKSITFSSFLLTQIDNNFIENKINEQKVEEFDSDESEDEDTNEDNNEDNNDDNEYNDNNTDNERPVKKCLEETEKTKLREEFTKYMSEQFLSGKDSEFYDYNECDHNFDLDFNKINERDIEDKYFDEED